MVEQTSPKRLGWGSSPWADAKERIIMTQPYQLWYYSANDNTLVIRKPGEPNHDHVFYGVDSIDFTNGLCFDTLEVSVYEVGANPNHPNIYDLVGTYKGEDVSACICAGAYKEYYKTSAMFEYNKELNVEM